MLKYKMSKILLQIFLDRNTAEVTVNNKITRMTFLTAIFALMVIMQYSPLAQISISYVTITFLHLFVLIGIYVFDDWKESLALGFFFGILSLILAFQFPVGPRLPFQNPFISVLPRVMFAMIAFGMLQLIKSKKNIIMIGMWAGISTIFHTTFVLSALALFNSPIRLAVLQGIILLNALPEVILAVFIVPIVGIEIKKYLNKK